MNHEMFMAILGIGFGLWAAVAGWGVARITRQVDRIQDILDELRVTMENRLSFLEGQAGGRRKEDKESN